MMETSLSILCETVREAAEKDRPLEICGSGSKAFYGEQTRTIAAQMVDMRSYSGITFYDPDELVLSAKAGTPLAEIETTLAEHRQMLSFEPPHFGPNATLGGTVACGFSGPRRAHAGAAKDFVIGMELINGNGEVLRFGGKVVKNVAGYDVHKLMVGAMGTLGLMTEITVSLRPKPVAETTLRFSCSAAEAQKLLNGWMAHPLPLSASFWSNGALFVRLSGSQAGVAAAAAILDGEALTEAKSAELWVAVREQQMPAFAVQNNERLWRISLPDTAPQLDIGNHFCMEWGGGLRWYLTDLPANEIRRIATGLGGHATLFRGEIRPGETVFTPVSSTVAAIQQRLKHTFDPQGVFNRGRLCGDF